MQIELYRCERGGGLIVMTWQRWKEPLIGGWNQCRQNYPKILLYLVLFLLLHPRDGDDGDHLLQILVLICDAYILVLLWFYISSQTTL